jgi:hypothetical protein
VANVDVLQRAWDILRTKGPALGLHVNPPKCEWSWLDPSCTAPCPLEGVALVPSSQVSMLGVPLGSDAFCASFVEGRLLPRLKDGLTRLESFNDSQSAMFLLRTSYGIVRANHFMRTTPLSLWEVHAQVFDEGVRHTAESILGFPFAPGEYQQACLTPSLGGLGLRRVVDHARAAFSASWRESLDTSGEPWSVPPGLVEWVSACLICHRSGNSLALG